MPEFPILETQRLILRAPVEADLDGFAALMADPDAARFIGGVQPRSMAWRGMANMAGSWVLKGYSMFSVVEKSSGQWIGRIGPWQPEGWPGPEVGWSILKPWWGRGLAYEASEACIDWAFDTLGWTEVIHTIEAANAPSIALAKRLGSSYMRDDRLPPPADLTLQIWGQTRAQWRARRGRQEL